MKDEQTLACGIHKAPLGKESSLADGRQGELDTTVPLNKVIKQWSDRKKTVMEPLFKSYIFAGAEKNKWDLMKIPGCSTMYIIWASRPGSNTVRSRRSGGSCSNSNRWRWWRTACRLTRRSGKTGLMMDYHGILLEVRGKKASVRRQWACSLPLSSTRATWNCWKGKRPSIFLYRQSGALLFTSRYLFSINRTCS